jgi:hypothetical protein
MAQVIDLAQQRYFFTMRRWAELLAEGIRLANELGKPDMAHALLAELLYAQRRLAQYIEDYHVDLAG